MAENRPLFVPKLSRVAAHAGLCRQRIHPIPQPSNPAPTYSISDRNASDKSINPLADEATYAGKHPVHRRAVQEAHAERAGDEGVRGAAS